MGLVHGLARDLRRPQKYLVQASHAFWLSSDDRSACSHGPGGHLCALSIGDVCFVRPAQVAVSEPEARRNDAALAPGSPGTLPNLVSNLPADSLHSRRAKQGDWGERSTFLNRSIIMRIDHPPHHKRA